MAINDPTPGAYTRQPGLRILLNGTAIPGAIEAEVVSNSYFHADTFSAAFALSADPGYGPSFWGSQDTMDLVVHVSVDGGASWTPLITGQVDKIDLHLDHMVVQVSGRDLTARLIDAKTNASYQNQTASQIATQLASNHGLTPDVQSTSTPVGRYYSQDHEHVKFDQFSRTTTEWDLLVSLAQHEGFDVWVDGSTLHFKPGPQPGDDPYVIQWQSNPNTANAVSIELERSLTLAKDVSVGIRSWSSRHAKGFTQWSGSSKASSPGTGTAQRYIFVYPNLSPDAAQKKADALREDITRRERLVTITAPGSVLLTPRNMVSVQGTGSSWDQTYYVDRITRHISWESGFTMDVRLKNHSPAAELAEPTSGDTGSTSSSSKSGSGAAGSDLPSGGAGLA